MTKRTRRLAAASCLLLATILWGGGFVAVKNSLDFITPLYMIALRFFAASFLLGIFFLKRLIKIKRTTLRNGIVLGFFLFAAYIFQTIGLQYTTAGKNAFLTTTYVMLVPFITWIIYKRNPGIHVFIAAFIAIAGIGLLSLNEKLNIEKGDALTLVCGFWFALHLIFIAHFTQKNNEDPIILAIVQMFFCAVFAAAAAPFFEKGFSFKNILELKPLLSLSYLILFSSSIAFLLQNVGQKHTLTHTAALILSLESFFGAFFSALFLGESMTPRMMLGCALLFFAIVLSETKFDFLRKKHN